MRTVLLAIFLALLLNAPQPADAQHRHREISIETEPVAYILGGAGITGSVQTGPWTYSVELYGELTVPESLHGNDGFSTALRGVILQAERFFTGTEGFYLGPELGISRIELTLKSTGDQRTFTGYSLGLRFGYHWETGLGNLYLSPVAGLGYTLNARDIEMAGNTFESDPLMPWSTIGIGWSF